MLSGASKVGRVAFSVGRRLYSLHEIEPSHAKVWPRLWRESDHANRLNNHNAIWLLKSKFVFGDLEIAFSPETHRSTNRADDSYYNRSSKLYRSSDSDFVGGNLPASDGHSPRLCTRDFLKAMKDTNSIRSGTRAAPPLIARDQCLHVWFIFKKNFRKLRKLDFFSIRFTPQLSWYWQVSAFVWAE